MDLRLLYTLMISIAINKKNSSEKEERISNQTLSTNILKTLSREKGNHLRPKTPSDSILIQAFNFQTKAKKHQNYTPNRTTILK